MSKGIFGFIIMVFLLVAVQRLMSPEFFTEVLGLKGYSAEQVKWFIQFLKPVILAAVFALSVSLIFGVAPLSSLGLALVGMILFMSMQSQWFLSILGLNQSEQVEFAYRMKFMAPVIIAGIMVAIGFTLSRG